MGSCSKDFLDQPVNNQLSLDQFYQTDEQAEQAIRAVYDILQWHYNSVGWAGPYVMKTMPSDEGTAGGSNAGDQPAIQVLDSYTYDAYNDVIRGAWMQNYYGVYRANLIINNIEPNTPLKAQVLAEAHALRAYYYLELVSQWGDVPLILKELTVSEYNQPRSPKADVYAQIEADLTAAIPELPLKSELTGGEKYKVSRGTAQALLGKAYLYQQKWNQAATTLGLVISSNQFDLVDYDELFYQSEEFGMESLLEASYTSTNSYDWGNFPWGESRNVESNIFQQLMGPREGVFVGFDSLTVGWGFNYPSQKLYDAFVAAGDSKRRKNTVLSQAEFEAMGGQVLDPNVWGYQGYIRTKYGTFIGESDASGIAALNYGTNWRLLRYADVLLMAAEAYYNDNNPTQALIELNKVRTRAGLPTISPSGTDIFEAIVVERQLELAFEGSRLMDLIRWGRAAQEIQGFQTGKHELFPIPATELLKAPNMAPNNPGW